MLVEDGDVVVDVGGLPPFAVDGPGEGARVVVVGGLVGLGVSELEGSDDAGSELCGMAVPGIEFDGVALAGVAGPAEAPMVVPGAF